MVDKTELLNQQTVLLPIYHSSKKSAGTNDMIEVTLSERGEFIKAEWMTKDANIIFPVTENSIIRAGKVIAPHPLCDELSYLSIELDPEKNREYENVRRDWISYMEEGHSNRLLKILDEYISQGTIFKDCIASLFSNMNYEIVKDYAVVINRGEKSEKTIHLDKTFVTFQIEIEDSTQENMSVSMDRTLHKNYIEYVRKKNFGKPQEKCDISGELTYCVSRHRGLLGNAKVVSISNHNETYFGRFDLGEEIIHIGYETSQKIHLMLKYLLENNQNKRYIGESCILINWFSDDIGNEEAINLISTISPERSSEEVELEDVEEDKEDDSPKTFGGSVSSAMNDYLTGKQNEVKPEGKFYLMILDKISNGRISVKYFRELPKSELFIRIEKWYQSTSWSFYNAATKKVIKETPSLFHYADAIYGMENEKGYMECRNTKLKTKTVERLLLCILEHRKIPQDMKNRMLENISNRRSYEKTWNYVLALGCSVFKKYQIDNQIKEGVSEMLDINEQNRSYLFGRLLAVYEKLEQDVINSRGTDDKDRRATNAERLWSAYTKMPVRTLKILEDKVRPYRERLIKSNYSGFKYYDNIITDIMGRLRERENYEQEKNRALDEEFVFGYYAQKQYFYSKKENSHTITDSNQIEGGNN
jgi:CRISPR-associated protein Cas8c/Csd1, subtype I-C/DVULG